MGDKVETVVIDNDMLINLNEVASQYFDKGDDWQHLFDTHLRMALTHFEKGSTENIQFFRDCVSRSNKVFEGVVNILYKSARLSGNPMIGEKIKRLSDQGKFPPIFFEKLVSYKDEIRNVETHEVLGQDFGKEEATRAILDALCFLIIGVGLDKFVNSLSGFNNVDYLILLTDAYFKTYKVFHRFLTSSYVSFLENSMFKHYLTISPAQRYKRLKPHYSFTIKDCASSPIMTLTELYLYDMNVMGSRWLVESDRILDRMERYARVFQHNHFIILVQTRRKHAQDLIDRVRKYLVVNCELTTIQ